MRYVGTSGTTDYTYDGDGQRVKKVSGGTTTVFVYDAQGQLAAEYSSPAAPLAGRKYVTVDHLGSTRLITDPGGLVLERHDYRPFGDEVTFGTGSVRQGIPGYMATRLKFTGKERDAESGLDYFGARYLSSAQGRFTSADPGPFVWIDPQTLNRYVYTRNHPLKYVDPSGQYFVVSSSDPHYKVYVQAIAKMLATPTGRAAVLQIAADPRPAIYKSGKLPKDPDHPTTNALAGLTKPTESKPKPDLLGVPQATATGTVTTIDFSNNKVDKTQAIEHETAHVSAALAAGGPFASAQAAIDKGDGEKQKGSGDTVGGSAEAFANQVGKEFKGVSADDIKQAQTILDRGTVLYQDSCDPGKTGDTSATPVPLK